VLVQTEYIFNRWKVTNYNGCTVNIWSGKDDEEGQYGYFYVPTEIQARKLWLKYRTIQNSFEIKMTTGKFKVKCNDCDYEFEGYSVQSQVDKHKDDTGHLLTVIDSKKD